MIQAQTPRYNAQDFEPNRWNGPFVFFCCAIGICIVAGIAFLSGMTLQAELSKEVARIEAAKPKRTTNLVNPPPALIKCDGPGREEFLRTCKARMRAGSL